MYLRPRTAREARRRSCDNDDGAVFRLVVSDIPEGKTDFVEGTYEIEVGKGAATTAVKIIDMLGEEVLVTRRLED